MSEDDRLQTVSELDRFRAYTSRYHGRITEQLYRDIKEVIEEVFNSEVVENV